MGVVLVDLAAAPVLAAGKEVRDFAISVDGKAAGKYCMTINDHGNGVFSMMGQADVRVAYLVYVYKYTYSGTEVWHGNRLVRLDSSTNDDGKQFQVSVQLANDRLQIKVNGQERVGRPDVWTTTYWRLPEAKLRTGGVSLLDSDTGRPIAARIQFVGTNAIQIAGQTQNCQHYRVTGDKIAADVWYDAQERLVRQESVEDGHRYVLDLIRVSR
jgi:hypothetical protein